MIGTIIYKKPLMHQLYVTITIWINHFIQSYKQDFDTETITPILDMREWSLNKVK